MNDVPPPLEIRLFGQADVIAGGRSVKFAKRSTTLAMIAYLVLRRGQSVARDFLAYTLFPDHDEEAALADLRRYLYLTLKALPPSATEPWLIVDSDTVRWNQATAAIVDVIAFEQLVRDDTALGRAVGLYGGDLLQDVYDDWVVVERERLRGLYLQALETLVARHRAAREYGIALGYAQRIVAVDTWREDVVRQMIAIRYAAGDAPGALGEYERFAKRLRDEMNIGPMPETIALRDLIVRNGPLPGSDRPVAPPADVRWIRVPMLPFIGREPELGRLHQHWDRAARGFGSLVVVNGEAGIGKTRLVGELARLVETEGGRVFGGSTSSPESPPYQCVVEALRAALPVLTAHPLTALTAGILARILPELRAEQSGALPVAPLAPERESARLLDAIAQAVVHVAGSRPLLLVLEDLHWAADTTLDALATIGRRVVRARALIVATYRDEETPAAHPVRRLITSLGTEQRITQVALERFDRAAVAQMLAPISALGSHDAAVVDRLYTLCEGNPLFLGEAIAETLESATPPEAVPAGIRSIISTRMERLTEAARTIAEIAAVSGHGCTVDVVRDVAGFGVAQTLAGFNELLDRRLMRESGARERFDFVFTHHLIGGSIYESMPAAVRLRRHARTAHVMEAQAQGTPSVRELARHYDLAQLPLEAVRWCLRAAREAAAVFAHDDVVRFTTIALAHAADCVDALVLRETAHSRLAARGQQAADLERLEALDLDPELRCHVAGRRVEFARTGGDRTAERAAVERLADAARSAGSAYWRGVAQCAQARTWLAVAAYDEARIAAAAALDSWGTDDPARDRIDALAVLIEVHASTADFATAGALLTRAESIARTAGDAWALAETLMQRAVVAMPQQRFGEVVDYASAAADRYREIGDRVGEARALATVATAAVRLSRWAQSRSANEAAAAIFEAVGDRSGLARVLMNLGMLHGRCGDLERARALIAAARDHHRSLGDERAHIASLLNESFLALWQNEPPAAKALAQDALQRARSIGHAAYHAQALANLGAAERDEGNVEAAVALMQEGLATVLGMGRMADAVSDLADLALAHAQRDDLRSAVAVAERILAVEPNWTSSAIFPPFPPWVVACIFHWAADPRARDMLEAAAGVARVYAESIDMPALRECFVALPFVLAIAEAVAHDRWPPQPSRRGAHAAGTRPA